MAEQQTLLLYTKETAEAIKKAMRLPPTKGEDTYYKPVPKQKLLNKPPEKVKATGGLQLVKITTPPNGNGGAAIGTIITINSDGTYTESGSEVAVICLALQ